VHLLHPLTNMAHLDDEAVEGSAEDAIIVVAVDQQWVSHCLISAHTVHNSLHRT
jgi:hypothetical protein